MPTRVKICGLSRPADIDAVNALMPDYVGFVFAPSRRQVSPAQAAKLRARLDPAIIPVGVFVDQPISEILALVAAPVIAAIQLHGHEDESYLRQLRALTDRPIIKALGVERPGEVQLWNDSAADYLLLDTSGGGTGQRFDWDLIGDVEKPFFLAGGLDPDNVDAAIAATSPYAVDVSSGVETAGVKDRAKIEEFIRRVRHHNDNH